MKRDHMFIWTPEHHNCAICGEGHHPWDGIGEKKQKQEQEKRQREKPYDD